MKKFMPRSWALLFCLGSFFAGMFFTNRMWTLPERLNSESGDCNLKLKIANRKHNNSVMQELDSQYTIQTLDSKISSLEMKLAAAKAEHLYLSKESTLSGNSRRKYFVVIGINTAFSSRKRRDSVRSTWMPQGEKRKKLEKEKGIIIRFVIGHSSTAGGILDKAIAAEEMAHGDFLRLQHVEGYMELSAKTKSYFTTALDLWDADFYVKVDDDVHVNLGTLGMTLSIHRMKPRVYIGCMKSGPVLARKGVRYHEPEYWKFGEVGNKYSGMLPDNSTQYQRIWQPTYQSTSKHVLHRYANEDVSIGSWFIGLDVEHVDDRRLCCGTPPDCEWKAQAGNACVASFDWKCSGICKSVERMMEVHKHCGEDTNALWTASL